MSVLEAILLGIVQGLTEFLPVSSSGHLAICEQLLGVDTNGGILFDVLLHFGTLIALVLVFRKDIKRLILETIRIIHDLRFNLVTFIHNLRDVEDRRYRKIIDNNYRKFVVMILAATLPTALIGYLMRSIAAAASATLLFPALGLLITGVLLLVVDYVETGKKIPKDVPIWNAFLIGVCQGIAVFPGISRSGTTITVCLLCGFNRKFAVKFSFIMSIPAIIGAMILEIKAAVGSAAITGSFVSCGIVGMIVAGVVGFFAIKTMLSMVQKKKLRIFAYYCFIVGITAIIGSFLL